MLYRFLIYNRLLRTAGMDYITLKRQRHVFVQKIAAFDFYL